MTAPSLAAVRMRRTRERRRQGDLVVSLEVGTNATADLVALGWLSTPDCGDKEAISRALLQLVRAAIGLRVTPLMSSRSSVCFLCEIQRSTIETLVEIDWLRPDQRDDHPAVGKTFRRFIRRALVVARNECPEPY